MWANVRTAVQVGMVISLLLGCLASEAAQPLEDVASFLASGGATPVIDYSVLAQTIKEVAHAIEMIQNQVRQIELALQELQALPAFALGGIVEDVRKMQALLERMQGLKFSLQQIEAQYKALYSISSVPRTSSATALHYQQMTRQLYDSLLNAMHAQSLIESQALDNVRLGQTLLASKSAVGNLQVQQTGNELLGMTIQHLMRAQQMSATFGRVVTSFMAQLNTSEAAAIMAKKRFYGVTPP